MIIILIQFKLSKIFKIIDAFSNKNIEDAVINVIDKSANVLNKKNGFYVFTNLCNREYTIKVSCKGFKDKIVNFCPEENNNLAELIMLIPSDENKTKIIKGTFKCSRRKMPLCKFYYAVCLKEFSVTVSGEVKKDDDFIKVQAYDDIFLEGRMFVLDNPNREIVTLGSYDFIGKKYKVKNNLSNNVTIGDTAFILFEGMTDENSEFEIPVPKIFQYKEFEMLFVLDGKGCCVKISNDDMIKVNIRS